MTQSWGPGSKRTCRNHHVQSSHCGGRESDAEGVKVTWPWSLDGRAGKRTHLTPPSTSSRTLGTSINLAMTQFSSLQNGDNSSPPTMGVLGDSQDNVCTLLGIVFGIWKAVEAR